MKPFTHNALAAVLTMTSGLGGGFALSGSAHAVPAQPEMVVATIENTARCDPTGGGCEPAFCAAWRRGELLIWDATPCLGRTL